MWVRGLNWGLNFVANAFPFKPSISLALPEHVLRMNGREKSKEVIFNRKWTELRSEMCDSLEQGLSEERKGKIQRVKDKEELSGFSRIIERIRALFLHTNKRKRCGFQKTLQPFFKV